MHGSTAADRPASPDCSTLVAQPWLLPTRQVIHDYEHMGLTNDFLISSSDQLALRYNDRVSTLRSAQTIGHFHAAHHP